jgi:hypothetical protein
VFLSYLTFYPPKKISTTPYKIWEKKSSKLGVQGIRRSGILLWFRSLGFGKREKFLQKMIFWGLEEFWKNVFLKKNLWELLDVRFLHIFEISTKFRFFWYPLRPILKNFFFHSYKGQCYLLEVKRSNKIENIQYFFIN